MTTTKQREARALIESGRTQEQLWQRISSLSSSFWSHAINLAESPIWHTHTHTQCLLHTSKCVYIFDCRVCFPFSLLGWLDYTRTHCYIGLLLELSSSPPPPHLKKRKRYGSHIIIGFLVLLLVCFDRKRNLNDIKTSVEIPPCVSSPFSLFLSYSRREISNNVILFIFYTVLISNEPESHIQVESRETLDGKYHPLLLCALFKISWFHLHIISRTPSLSLFFPLRLQTRCFFFVLFCLTCWLKPCILLWPPYCPFFPLFKNVVANAYAKYRCQWFFDARHGGQGNERKKKDKLGHVCWWPLRKQFTQTDCRPAFVVLCVRGCVSSVWLVKTNSYPNKSRVLLCQIFSFSNTLDCVCVLLLF